MRNGRNEVRSGGSMNGVICRFPRHGRQGDFRSGPRRQAGGFQTQPAARPEPRRRHASTVQAFVFEFAAAAGNLRNPRATHLYTIDSDLSRSGAQRLSVAVLDEHERPSSRPQRILSSRGRAALDQLNALGAAISADFTVQELRHAFRTLARQFTHTLAAAPSRKPGSPVSSFSSTTPIAISRQQRPRLPDDFTLPHHPLWRHAKWVCAKASTR